MKSYIPKWKEMSLSFVLFLILSGCNGMPSEQTQSGPTAIRVPTSTDSPRSKAPATPVPTGTVNAVASATPVLTATLIPTPTVAVAVSVQQASAPKGIIYRDDFTDPKSGWPNSLEFGNYYIGYHEPNDYHVEVHVPNDRAVVAVPKRTFGDFTMETEVQADPNNTAKAGNFRYGLVFRRSGNQYYAFVVSPRAKTWHVLKSSPGGLVELKKGSSDSIQGLTADDTLRVDAKGSTFFFHINDQDVGQVSDADYAGGEVGFFVETQDSPRAHVHYDTTIIREVETAAAPKGIIYRDDFTDPKSGWPNSLEFGNYYIGYHEPNDYHVEVHVPNDRAVVAVPKRTFGDFTMETEVQADPNNTAKAGNFRYGLVFRRSGNQYYAFVVSPRAKTWHVLKSSPGGLVELKKGSSDSIQGLTADDTLRVDAKGSTFFFHINDQDVGQVSDADYAGGEVGFFVETQDSPRAHVHYDTTIIREVETPQLVCTVTAEALNVRGGPSITSMVIMVIQRNARLEPLVRSADGYWINVRVEGGNQVGWVSSTPGLTACNVPVGDLPVRQG